MFKKLSELPRRQKQIIMVTCDVMLLPLAFWAAVAVRNGSFDPSVGEFNWLFLIIPIISVPVLMRLGLYRTVIRYADEKLISLIVAGVSLSILGLSLLVFMTRIVSLPRSSIIIYWFLAISYLILSRWTARLLFRGFENRQRSQQRKRIAIFGAGKAGTQMAMALSSSPEFKPVVFFDDDPDLLGTQVLGIRVYSREKAAAIISKYNVQALLIAIPTASRSRRKEIISQFEQYGLELKTLPGLAELVGGRVRVEDIREVGIEDLLGRDPVPPSESLFAKCVTGKRVLVTGAGGSIGSELCRQILKSGPERLVLYEVSEFSLYKIEQEFRSFGLNTQIFSILGDVRDKTHIARVISEHHVQTVYHAAAYKHVPLVEKNIVPGLTTNVFGTLNTALAAMENDVETFVLISSDKAVRPTNIMGASKRLAELILQGIAKHVKERNTRFCMVRFGNVLGSSGSVVPLFKDQIRRGGPVTVTHKEMTRYFMTIPEAAQLVLQAGGMGTDGTVFVLDMGESVKIMDLARNMINLSGLRVKDDENPEGDIEIQVTGLRPGEKLYEELLIGNNVSSTSHPRIMMADESYISWTELSEALEKLRSLCADHDEVEARKLLKSLVVEYAPAKGV